MDINVTTVMGIFVLPKKCPRTKILINILSSVGPGKIV